MHEYAILLLKHLKLSSYPKIGFSREYFYKSKNRVGFFFLFFVFCFFFTLLQNYSLSPFTLKKKKINFFKIVSEILVRSNNTIWPVEKSTQL